MLRPGVGEDGRVRKHDDEEDVEEVPLCRDVAASACSFGFVLAQIKELVCSSAECHG